MKTQRLGIALTLINLVILIFVLFSGNSHPAAADDVVPVLRGKKLEIVDDQGKVRAQIVVNPPSTGPDGKNIRVALFFG